MNILNKYLFKYKYLYMRFIILIIFPSPFRGGFRLLNIGIKKKGSNLEKTKKKRKGIEKIKWIYLWKIFIIIKRTNKKGIIKTQKREKKRRKKQEEKHDKRHNDLLEFLRTLKKDEKEK